MYYRRSRSLEELIQREDRTVFTELVFKRAKRQMMKMMMFQISVKEKKKPSNQGSHHFTQRRSPSRASSALS
jgi:hypothetical protein